MAPQLNCDVSDGVWEALHAESERTGDSLARVVDRNLSSALGLDRHSLFQVSTSTALVEGVFRGAVTVGDLRRHGDFGLGTYDGLDGELVMVDGACFRIGGGGSVAAADDGWEVPFAVVTRFVPDDASTLASFATLAELEASLDDLRPIREPLCWFANRGSLRATLAASGLQGRGWGGARCGDEPPERVHRSGTSTERSSGSGPRSTQRRSTFPAITSTSSQPTTRSVGTSSTRKPARLRSGSMSSPTSTSPFPKRQSSSRPISAGMLPRRCELPNRLARSAGGFGRKPSPNPMRTKDLIASPLEF